MKKTLTYSDAIEKIMLGNGYFAPLKLLYSEIWKYKDKSSIRGKTPCDTIREKVQRDKRFKKIGLGVYALEKHLNKLPKEIEPKTQKAKKEKIHAKIQGMLLEIGNQRGFDTYTNDKKWTFDGKILGNIATIPKIPLFTYEKIIKRSAVYIDVVWFNERKFPVSVFEVEQSTDFRGAFVKFMELQDFKVKFYCISSEERESKFNIEKEKAAFRPISGRVKFFSYQKVEQDYERSLGKYNL